MPYCQSTGEWFPARVTVCVTCGGPLSAVPPPDAVARGVGRARDPRGEELALPDWQPYLPRDEDSVDLAEAQRIVAAFEEVRPRARGRRAAPASSLPASGTAVATALSRVAGETTARRDIRRVREAFVDLQAFVPDEAAAAVEALPRVEHDPLGRARAREVLARIRHAKARAIAVLRGDDRVHGAANALFDVDGTIGQARQDLDAVDRYKVAQVASYVAVVVWPVGLVVGLVAGTMVGRPSIVAMLLVGALVVAGWTLFLGPLWGYEVGTLTSRIDRLAMRADHAAVVAGGRALAHVFGLVGLLGGPVVIGLGAVLVAQRLGLP